MNKRKILQHSLVMMTCIMIVFSLVVSSAIALGSGNGQCQNGVESPGNDDTVGNGIQGSNSEGTCGVENCEDSGFQNQYRWGDSDGDNVDDECEHHQWRQMHLIREQNRTCMQSEWQNETQSDALFVNFSIEEGIVINVLYESTKNPNNVFGYSITINEILEFLDNNMNGRFDTEDTRISGIDLDAVEFSPIIYQNTTSTDGEEVWRVSTGTVDGLFTIVLYMTGNYSLIDGSIISPSEVKIDFFFNEYPFIENTSMLSLGIDVESAHSMSLETDMFDEIVGFSSDEFGLNISSGLYAGFFSWIDTALVDNKSVPVNVSVVSGLGDAQNSSTSKSTIWFSYPQGSKIIHDPKVGVIPVSYQSATSIVETVLSLFEIGLYYGCVCIIAGLLFIGAVWFRRRK